MYRILKKQGESRERSCWDRRSGRTSTSTCWWTCSAATTSKTVALLLADLGVTKTHSRLHVSDNNPFSEAQFKTLKYRPDFPVRFGFLQHARAWCAPFFTWYNHHHRHSDIAYLTPAKVHAGRAQAVLPKRTATLETAARAHPERFVRGAPSVPRLPEAGWMNPPQGRFETEKGGCRGMDSSIIMRNRSVSLSLARSALKRDKVEVVQQSGAHRIGQGALDEVVVPPCGRKLRRHDGGARGRSGPP